MRRRHRAGRCPGAQTAASGRCILAFWHHPRFSSGPHGSDAATAAFWEALLTDSGKALCHSALPSRAASTINFRAGTTRANNAALALGVGGEVAVRCAMPSGTAHFLLDVSGYLR